jgi:selenium metabolism protein YedF
MSEKLVDARGRACPQPVLLTRQAWADGARRIRVLVDNEGSAENVRRMATSLGCRVETSRAGTEIQILAVAGENAPSAAEVPEPELLACETPGADPSLPKRPVVFVDTDQFGRGDAELGRILMRGFLKTLKEVEPLPATLIFANHGVRLTTDGSDLLDDLAELADRGVELLSCGTCLDFLGLEDSLRVGRVSNMYEIASALLRASSVVKP